MTNEKALILNNVCNTLETEYFKSDSKFEIPKPLIYAATKNTSKTKGVVSEKKELDETILKVFKKDIDFDEKKIGEDKAYEEKVNADYREYLKSDTVKEQIELFFNTEAKIDIHKVKAEVLDEAILPSAYKEILEELIVE